MKTSFRIHGFLLVIMSTAGCVSGVNLRVPTLPPVPSEGILEEFRVTGDGDALLLPVSFGGEAYLFLLDTGAEATVCDESRRNVDGPRRRNS